MFEESKAWLLVFIISVLIGIGYCAHYLTMVDEANLALEESKSKFASNHELLSVKKKNWADVENLVAKNRELSDQNSLLIKAKEALDTRYRKVEGELNYAVESTKMVVDKVRSNAPGTELGDITLTNGKMLRGAKVRKLDQSGISLIHADGIGLVATDLLPAEIQERFDLGPSALFPQMQQAQALFLEKAIPSVVDDSSSSKVAGIKKRIALLEIQTESSAKHKEKLEKEVKDIEEQIKAADTKRFPTQTLRTMKDIAEGNAGMARNEVKVQKLELEKLKAELDTLLNKK
jgi:predicted ATP-grasp superfamily ATP-dependent carboligase